MESSLHLKNKSPPTALQVTTEFNATGNHRMQRSGGRVGFEVNAFRAGPLMRVDIGLERLLWNGWNLGGQLSVRMKNSMLA